MILIMSFLYLGKIKKHTTQKLRSQEVIGKNKRHICVSFCCFLLCVDLYKINHFFVFMLEIHIFTYLYKIVTFSSFYVKSLGVFFFFQSFRCALPYIWAMRWGSAALTLPSQRVSHWEYCVSSSGTRRCVPTFFAVWLSSPSLYLGYLTVVRLF